MRRPTHIEGPHVIVPAEREFHLTSDAADPFTPGKEPARPPTAPVPLEHRTEWLRRISGTGFRWAEIRAADGRAPSGAFPVEAHRTRALPGTLRLRVRYFGLGLEPRDLEVALAGLVDEVEEDPRIVGVNVEGFLLDAESRRTLDASAAGLGYRPARSPGRYRYTPWLDLTPEEADIFSALSGTCRRFIRNPVRRGFSVAPLRAVRWAPQMAELWTETFTRTGSAPPERDWTAHLRFARDYPGLYRIVGLYSPDAPPDRSLRAFACARNNGSHAVFSDGASTRRAEPGLAMGYAPMWALIRWARRQGCTGFDLGGTTHDPDDALAGISEFKRRFTDQVIDVGREWEYRSRSLRGRAAGVASWAASVLRRTTGTP